MVLFAQCSVSLLLAFVLPLFPSSSLCFPFSGSIPLMSLGGAVRHTHLYTDNDRRGMFLEITPEGNVLGGPGQTLYSVMELRAVQPGQTVIRGVASSLYLCMDRHGRLRGERHYTEVHCSFRELLLADGYTRFLSSHHGLPVSLASRRSPGQHHVPFTRFLPLLATLRAVDLTEGPPALPSHNVDSDDPLGLHLRGFPSSVVSPQFSQDR